MPGFPGTPAGPQQATPGVPAEYAGPPAGTPGVPAGPQTGAPGVPPAPEIFISYRRDDASFATSIMYTELEKRLAGREHPVFKDIDTINPGEHFPTVLKQALGSCKVGLVVIGHHWLEIKDQKGQRRLDDLQDYVRQEIEVLLSKAAKQETHVIPVLLDGTRMPSKADLPPSIAHITDLQCVEVRSNHLSDDIGRLLAKIRPYIDSAIPPALYGRIVGIAHNIHRDETSAFRSSTMKVLRFLLTQYDADGNLASQMEIQMRGSRIENYSYLSDGDVVEVVVSKQPKQEGELFQSRWIYNRKTRSVLRPKEAGVWKFLYWPYDEPYRAALISSALAPLIFLMGVYVIADSIVSGSGTLNQLGEGLILGGILSAVGVVLIWLVIDALLKTNGFSTWKNAGYGDLGHPIVRWLGPIILFTIVSVILVLMWLRQFQKKR
jgi:hypothetical protein